jgi:hypothetical protein
VVESDPAVAEDGPEEALPEQEELSEAVAENGDSGSADAGESDAGQSGD